MSERYDEKIADHAFEAIKFLLGLFVGVLTAYVAVLAALLSWLSSVSTVASLGGAAKIALLALGAFVFFYMWVTCYLVIRAAREYRSKLIALGGEKKSPRLIRANKKLVSVGIVCCLAGSILIGIMSWVVLVV